MSYTVLARKYRSRTFDEVIGQDPIATTLKNAITAERLHHGYLFTGTRGCGKTSMARILARSLNCLKAKGPTVSPCLECDSCKAIGEGQDIDVVEIDAASNTGVDNIRELRSNAAYRPARSRFKIYIIDEVHMLSTGAFNALLKTLEEPPEHVKFILATTEMQKVPATIRSRCQCFSFRNIAPDVIAKRLDEIAAEEGAKVEPAVTRRIARLANGSMRDGLSIMDQLLAVSPKKLDSKVLDDILPPVQDEQVFALFQTAAADDVAGVLGKTEGILSGGRGLDVFCHDLIEVARTLMLIRACGPDTGVVDFPAGNRDEYVKLAGGFELSQYVQMIAMFEELRRNVRFSGAGRALTDAVMVRLARMRAWSAIETLLAGSAGGDDEKKKPQPPVATPARPQPTAQAASPSAARPAERVVAGPRSADRASLPESPAQRPTDAPSEPVAAGPSRAAAPPRPESSGAAPQPERYGRAAAPAAPRASAVPAPAAAPEPEWEDDRPDADYSDVAEASLGSEEDAAPLAESVRSRDPLLRREVTQAEQARIMNDPAVKQAVELFRGTIVNMEFVTPVRGAGEEDE
ncbi:MAG: DNA polymerase III subunit gamma/tau [Planctomycetota bacterium]